MVELCYLDTTCLYKNIYHTGVLKIERLFAFTEDECIECQMVYPINCKHLNIGCVLKTFW